MLIRTPLCKPRQVFEHVFRIGMKDVGPVLVHENARIVVVVECIAADVRPPIDEQDRSARIGRQPFCHHTAGKTGPDDEVVEHWNYDTGDAPGVANTG